MAKMIKCPTCGTQIEVPPQAAGQIVKCPGCGKGLKLVAKAKPGAGAGGQQQHAGAGMSGNPGGSVAGGSVSAMTFVGDAPPLDRPGPALDDLPSLDSNCAVCGRSVDPSDLIEDNGRLVCMDCIKGARSAIARPEGGADLIDFAPSAGPVRRGKLINFTPSFMVGTLAALVLIGCQIYLTLFEKPVGKLTALRPTPGPRQLPGNGTSATPASPDDSFAGAATPGTSTTAPAGAPDDTAATPPASGAPDATAGATPAPPSPTPGTDAPPPDAGSSPPPSSTNPAVADATSSQQGSLFTDDSVGTPGGSAAANGAAAGAAPADPGAAAPAAPDAPAPIVASADPLDRGMAHLMAREYAKAIAELDQARLRHVVGKLPPVGRPLTPAQQLILEGLAAAYIGQGRAELARGQLDAAYQRNVRTRSLVLNTAIYMMSAQRPLASLMQAADVAKTQLTGPGGDEYAADIFGTLVSKIAANDKAPKEKVAAYWQVYDNYVDQLAARGGIPGAEGKLKWGIDWLPAEDVKAFRIARAAGNVEASLTTLAKEADAARARVKAAEAAYTKAVAARASNQPADVQGAQNQLDAANAALVKAQKAVTDATAALAMKKPRWLTKFEPVLPSPVVPP